MRFLRVALAAPAGRLPELRSFYLDTLGFVPGLIPSQGGFTFTVGETALQFVPGPGEPFYHLALLVPGNGFAEALFWARDRTPLVPDSRSGEEVFDFHWWAALACYFHDPAGNIVELIAHSGIDESPASGPFAASEIAGLSELGLVGDPAAMAEGLASVGVEVWDGDPAVPGQLAFAGEQARTLILAPPGRGWLPSGRPAEAHPVEVVLEGGRAAAVELDGGRYRVSVSHLRASST